MPSDSISAGLIFQNFLGGMPQTPLGLACFGYQIVYFAHDYHAHAQLHNSAPLPFQNPGFAPEYSLINHKKIASINSGKF